MRESRDMEAALVAIIRCSHAMRNAGADERWDIVAAYETERRIMIGKAFAGVRSGEAARKAAAAIDQLRNMDAGLIEKLRAARDTCGHALQGLRRGTLGVHAYAGIGAG